MDSDRDEAPLTSIDTFSSMPLMTNITMDGSGSMEDDIVGLKMMRPRLLSFDSEQRDELNSDVDSFSMGSPIPLYQSLSLDHQQEQQQSTPVSLSSIAKIQKQDIFRQSTVSPLCDDDNDDDDESFTIGRARSICTDMPPSMPMLNHVGGLDENCKTSSYVRLQPRFELDSSMSILNTISFGHSFDDDKDLPLMPM
jgi:hypothetical protein